jgi:hypothetical protein
VAIFGMSAEMTDRLPIMLDAAHANKLAATKARFFDDDLSRELALLLEGKGVGICGYSPGLYVQRLREHRSLPLLERR